MAKGFQQPKLVPFDGFELALAKMTDGGVRPVIDIQDNGKRVFYGFTSVMGLVELGNAIDHILESAPEHGVNVVETLRSEGLEYEPTYTEVMAGEFATVIKFLCDRYGLSIADVFRELHQHDLLHRPSGEQIKASVNEVLDVYFEFQKEVEGR